ncbi:hypothetical protein [Algoriphagus pacificus]|uniref:Chaperone of endosialidase n=1 Tax=Algoriphagus pacificus TaxID=2811234 RepID=A0ABS3CMJ5_9BACT|nr:hypothetical protein [Algoriphagus pacificus]MBN7817465.1 hypothetical protein [Algoriphagus pacificus]
MLSIRRQFLGSLIGLLLLIPIYTIAQNNTFPTSGNVGIGTTGPSSKLHVVGEIRSQGNIRLQSPDGNDAGNIETSGEAGSYNGIKIRATRGTGYISFWTNNSSTTEKMRIQNNGNVGIGTSSPTYKLQVAGNSKWTGNASSYTEVNSNSSGQYMRQYGNDGLTQSWLIRGYSHTDGVQAFFDNGGINVNGTVKAREVNVTASEWPDYVFKFGYKLMPLSELEEFVEKNGHLPNVPSEAEVLENGINLSEMNVKLLEKVEELTLYILSQRSIIESQEKLLNTLLKRVEKIESNKNDK